MLAAAPSLGRKLVWATICVLVVAFAVGPVLASHDVYSYLDYARLGVVHGLDPYLRPPAAAPADPIYPKVAWTGTTSAYGPLFTLASYPLAWLPVGVAVAALKAGAAAATLGLAAVVGKIARARGVEPLRAAVFVALNPLVLVQVVGGAHNDAVAMLLATLGVAAVLTARQAAGGAAFAAAFAIKAPAAFALPFALLGARRASGRFALGAAAAIAAIAAVGYVAFGLHWVDSFGIAAENQGRTSHLSVPIVLSHLGGIDPVAARIAALSIYGLVVVGLLVWTWRGGDWLRAAGWAGAGLLLATAWLLPWYLIWALPLVALSRDRPLQVLTLALTAYQLGAHLSP